MKSMKKRIVLQGQNKKCFSIEDMFFRNHKKELFLWKYESMILYIFGKCFYQNIVFPKF